MTPCLKKMVSQLKEPQDYLIGVGKKKLPSPDNILIFSRLVKNQLQQEAPQNRTHHRFVLVFNFETKGQIHVDHLTFPFCPGQALLIHPFQFHHYSQLASFKLKWLFCTFEMENGAVLEPLRDRVLDISPASAAARNALLTEWQRSSDPAWQSELQDTQLQTALVRLLFNLLRDRQIAAPDFLPESKDSLIRTVNRLLAEHRSRPVAVSDLAQALNLSASRLRVVFKDAAGIPLGSYIQNYRLNRAMALLRTTSLPVTDVSAKAGFGSPQAFSRTFKKETGHTPRTYRKN
jgi:AraC-like DNA-binding protein